MSLGWIYAFKDRNYDRGIKIGRDSHHPTRFKHAQCYTPRGIDLVAVWHIAGGFDSLAQAERTARLGLPLIEGPNSGAEWCNVTATNAVAQVSSNLRLDPKPNVGNPRITSTYDDFRDLKKLGNEIHRQILWLYQENGTSLLKVQRTASWKVPQEPVKTYSLLGFRPVAAFWIVPGGKLQIENRRTDETWISLVQEYGHGVDHIQVGWLRSGATPGVLVRAITAHGLRQIEDLQQCPPGVRPGY